MNSECMKGYTMNAHGSCVPIKRTNTKQRGLPRRLPKGSNPSNREIGISCCDIGIANNTSRYGNFFCNATSLSNNCTECGMLPDMAIEDCASGNMTNGYHSCTRNSNYVNICCECSGPGGSADCYEKYGDLGEGYWRCGGHEYDHGCGRCIIVGQESPATECPNGLSCNGNLYDCPEQMMCIYAPGTVTGFCCIDGNPGHSKPDLGPSFGRRGGRIRRGRR